MKKIIQHTIIILLTLFSSHLVSGQMTPIAGELIIQLKPGFVPERLEWRINEAFPEAICQLKSTISLSRRLFVLQYEPTFSMENALFDWLYEAKEVELWQRNYLAQERNTDPDDPEYNLQWHLSRIQAPYVWDITTGGVTAGGDTVVIAVFDGGYEATHPDFSGNIWVNKDEIPDNFIDDDQNGYTDDFMGFDLKNNSPEHIPAAHGTEVVGVMSARGNNGQFGAGLNWQVKTMLLSLGGSSSLPVDKILESYYYALEQRKRYNQSAGEKGAFVVAFNSSFGIDRLFCDATPLWNAAIDSLGAHGILSIGAAANIDHDVDVKGDVPSTCISPYQIAVTASSNPFESAGGEQKSGSAAYGIPSVDIAAPGEDVYTTSTNEGFKARQGTSFATPLVSGAIALLYSADCNSFIQNAYENPSGAALDVKSFILGGADELNSLEGLVVTGGRLNVKNSLQLLQTYCGGKEGLLAIDNIFPNPSNSTIKATFTFPEFKPYNWHVYNAIGQNLQSGTLNPQRFAPNILEVDVSSFLPGVYWLTIENARGIESARFLVR